VVSEGEIEASIERDLENQGIEEVESISSGSSANGDSESDGMIPLKGAGTSSISTPSGIQGFYATKPTLPSTWSRRDLPNRESFVGETFKCCDDDDPNPDCGCTVCSTICCQGRERVGNMVVLKGGEVKGNRGEYILHYVIGPFWPMLVFITYPLIIGVSFFVYTKISPILHPLILLSWFAFTATVCVALFYTGCKDPGILPRYTNQPTSSWRWNDQAKTYRPPGAIYDDECGVIVEEFDHTCPWTGTAIGRKNMSAFKVFVGGLCALIVVDIILTSGAMTVGQAS